MSDSEPDLWRHDEARFAKKRSEFIERVAGIERKKARAIAWSELGYSHAGIAAQLNVTAGTVGSWLDDVAREYDEAVVYAKRASDLGVTAEVPGVERDE